MVRSRTGMTARGMWRLLDKKRAKGRHKKIVAFIHVHFSTHQIHDRPLLIRFHKMYSFFLLFHNSTYIFFAFSSSRLRYIITRILLHIQSSAPFCPKRERDPLIVERNHPSPEWVEWAILWVPTEKKCSQTNQKTDQSLPSNKTERKKKGSAEIPSLASWIVSPS